MIHQRISFYIVRSVVVVVLLDDVLYVLYVSMHVCDDDWAVL